MRLKELLEAGEVDEAGGDMDQAVTGLSYDSRRVKKGHIFFAVPGERLDGHEFAAQALEQGAAAVVMERRVSLPQSATWIRVRNVRRTMGMWSALFFASPSRRMVLVGITGTNGKTTVSYLLESIFSAAGMAPGVIGTINYRYQGRILAAPHTPPRNLWTFKPFWQRWLRQMSSRWPWRFPPMHWKWSGCGGSNLMQLYLPI